MDQIKTKKCPYCAEEIKADAIVCRFCNRNLVDEVYSPIRIEVTSKKFKKHFIIADALIIIGFLLLINGCSRSMIPNNYGDGALQISLGILLIFIGIIWLVVTKIGLWWKRG